MLLSIFQHLSHHHGTGGKAQSHAKEYCILGQLQWHLGGQPKWIKIWVNNRKQRVRYSLCLTPPGKLGSYPSVTNLTPPLSVIHNLEGTLGVRHPSISFLQKKAEMSPSLLPCSHSIPSAHELLWLKGLELAAPSLVVH